MMLLALAASATGQDKNREEIAVMFLGQLYSLPDNPMTTSPAHNELLKKSAARTLIYAYALRKKLGADEEAAVSGHVSGDDIRSALQELNLASFEFAKRMFTKPNDETLFDAMNRLNRAAASNPGLVVLREMLRLYGN